VAPESILRATARSTKSPLTNFSKQKVLSELLEPGLQYEMLTAGAVVALALRTEMDC